MFALLTLPRGVPVEYTAASAPEAHPPIGIIIRPGPPPAVRRWHDRSAPARGALDSIT